MAGEYRSAGIVADVNGVNIEIACRAGELVIIPPPGLGALYFDDAGSGKLRELLDRAAMPGQS